MLWLATCVLVPVRRPSGPKRLVSALRVPRWLTDNTGTDAASSLVNVHDGLARWKENESNLNDPSAALVQTAETLEDWMAVYDAKKKGGGLDNLSSEILSASAALVKLLPAKSEN